MKLHELLRQTGFEKEAARLPDFLVSAVVQDSRKARAGAVFVAVRGAKGDGAAFVADAAKGGAGLVVGEGAAPAEYRGPYLAVPNARRAYALWNHHLFGRPSEALTLVGVTGTNGKTTSAYLLREIFSRKKKTGMLGTIAYEFGKTSIPASHTTPDAAELQSLLARMRGEGCEVAVMEASSHALDQERLAGLAFDAALFTNLTQDHLDYHGTMDAYFEAKGKLFALLKKGGNGVLNADDPYADRFRDASSRSVTYGIDQPAHYRAVRVRSDLKGSLFEIEHAGSVVPVVSPLIGRHNVYNALGAMAAAHTLGVGLEESAEAVRNFRGVPGRLERVEAGQDFDLFVDYAHTDDGLHNVLKALKPFVAGELLLLFGCGGDRDRGKRPKMARAAEAWADFVVLTSDNPRSEDPRAILKEAAAGFSPGFKHFDLVPDRAKAIRRVLLKARKGDVVLLAGKGHEEVQVIGERQIPFSDKAESLKVLRGR